MNEDEGSNQLEVNEVIFAEQVRVLREERRWSQEDLAKRMRDIGLDHVTQATVSRIENRQRPVRLMEADVLASIFERPIQAMMYPDSSSAYFGHAQRQFETARQRYIEFKLAAEAMVSAQANYAHNFEVIREMSRDHFDPRMDRIVDSFMKRIDGFIRIDPVQEVVDIVHSTPRF